MTRQEFPDRGAGGGDGKNEHGGDRVLALPLLLLLLYTFYSFRDYFTKMGGEEH